MPKKITESHWRTKSRSVIYQTLLEYEAQQTCLGEGIDKKQAIRLISDAYPFGQRELFPYKVWLSERKRAIAFLDSGLEMRQYHQWAVTAAELKRRKVVAVSPGQIPLLAL